MNKKGFTLVELLVSFVLSMIIVIILFQLIISLKDVYMSSGLKTELLNKQNLMTNKIYTDLLDKTVSTISNCEDTDICIEFLFSDSTSKKLIVDQTKKTLTYDDYVIKLNNKSYFDNIYINTKESAVINNKYNKILDINIPIYNDSFDNTDFGLNIVYMYDESNIINNVSDMYGNNQHYQDIEYIYSDGNQYINTNYMAKTTTEIQLDIELIENENTYLNSISGYYNIIGKEYMNSENAFNFNFGELSDQNKKINYWVDKTWKYGGTTYTYTYDTVTPRSTFIVKSGSATFQGKTNDIAIKTDNNTENMILLGSFNSDQNQILSFNRYDAKIYGFKIYEGDTLIKDMVPVKRNVDGVVGLYDKVEGIFYRSNSGIDFIYNEV